MTKTGEWKVNFELTLDGKTVSWYDLDPDTQKHILDCIKDGYMGGEIVEEHDEEIAYCPHCGKLCIIPEDEIETDELGEHMLCPYCKGKWDTSWNEGELKKGDKIFTVTRDQIYESTIEYAYNDENGKRWYIDSDDDDIDIDTIGKYVFAKRKDAEKWRNIITKSPARAQLNLAALYGAGKNERMIDDDETEIDIFGDLIISRRKEKEGLTFTLMQNAELEENRKILIYPQIDGHIPDIVIVTQANENIATLKNEYGIEFTLTKEQFDKAVRKVANL